MYSLFQTSLCRPHFLCTAGSVSTFCQMHSSCFHPYTIHRAAFRQAAPSAQALRSNNSEHRPNFQFHAVLREEAGKSERCAASPVSVREPSRFLSLCGDKICSKLLFILFQLISIQWPDAVESSGGDEGTDQMMHGAEASSVGPTRCTSAVQTHIQSLQLKQNNR